tara:strand:+ start:13 stop:777 length:765 start_codon:yes stop_codon:yes gene_type:complete
MNTVILCGGLGTRLSEETKLKPKPMVEIGGKPILWHIMKIYHKYNFNKFSLALGYKGEMIKDYFLNYHSRQSDFEVDLKNGSIKYKKEFPVNFNISMIDTGQNTMTGGRLLRLKKELKDKGTFMLTYGDGVSNVNINSLIDFHKSHGKIATITAVRPPVRFGKLIIDDNKITQFQEKPKGGEGWINGGFFVFESEIFDYLENDSTFLERDPLENLSKDNQLMAYKHNGYWQCMDTIRDKINLEDLWNSGNAPWK